MSELLIELQRCLGIDELKQTIVQLDDHHSPTLGDSVWRFTYRKQVYEFVRHGGYLRPGTGCSSERRVDPNRAR